MILVIAPVYELCYLLVAWLSLYAGTSRETSNTVLKALHLIILTILELICAALTSMGLSNITVDPAKFDIPADIRTLYTRQQLEPDILRTICCPKCYKLYDGEQAIPLKCTWKRSSRARECGADLYVQRNTRMGPTQVPKTLFNTQSFQSWLISFLAQAEVGEALHETFAKQQYQLNTDRMHDVQDSPAWQSLQGFLQSPYHLVFALYIDWFNPFTNKIAGKLSWPFN